VSPIQRKAIDDLVSDLGGDQATVAEILASFLEEAPTVLEQLRQAAAAKDLEGARRAAHTLKSTSAQFGAMALSEKCKEAEFAAKAGTLPAPGVLAELQRLWEAAKAELVVEQRALGA
jgi:HPt (histidine-containing phosphotransfer) domain-containing protein